MLAAVAAGAVYQAVLLTGAGVSCIALLTPPEEALQGNKGRGGEVIQTPCQTTCGWRIILVRRKQVNSTASLEVISDWFISILASQFLTQLPDWLDNNTSVHVPRCYENHSQNVALPQCGRRVVCLGRTDNSGWYFSSAGLLVLINALLARTPLKDCEFTPTGCLIL